LDTLTWQQEVLQPLRPGCELLGLAVIAGPVENYCGVKKQARVLSALGKRQRHLSAGFRQFSRSCERPGQCIVRENIGPDLQFRFR